MVGIPSTPCEDGKKNNGKEGPRQPMNQIWKVASKEKRTHLYDGPLELLASLEQPASEFALLLLLGHVALGRLVRVVLVRRLKRDLLALHRRLLDLGRRRRWGCDRDRTRRSSGWWRGSRRRRGSGRLVLLFRSDDGFGRRGGGRRRSRSSLGLLDRLGELDGRCNQELGWSVNGTTRGEKNVVEWSCLSFRRGLHRRGSDGIFLLFFETRIGRLKLDVLLLLDRRASVPSSALRQVRRT